MMYDADRVTLDYWVPTLERLSKPREVAPLKPNRAMRRAKGPKKSYGREIDQLERDIAEASQ
jgi:hypothetical protein